MVFTPRLAQKKKVPKHMFHDMSRADRAKLKRICQHTHHKNMSTRLLPSLALSFRHERNNSLTTKEVSNVFTTLSLHRVEGELDAAGIKVYGSLGLSLTTLVLSFDAKQKRTGSARESQLWVPPRDGAARREMRWHDVTSHGTKRQRKTNMLWHHMY